MQAGRTSFKKIKCDEARSRNRLSFHRPLPQCLPRLYLRLLKGYFAKHGCRLRIAERGCVAALRLVTALGLGLVGGVGGWHA